MSATEPKIVAVGEILWDLLPAGRQMGGAPANFACHAQALGADAFLVSCIGDDSLGHELLGRLRQLQLSTDGIAVDPTHPTGSVEVEISGDGQPRFIIHDQVAWDFLQVSPASERAAAEADAVCFGSLAQRSEVSRAAIHAVVSAARPEALRVFDVNLRQDFYSRAAIEASLKAANVVKLNDAELPVVADFLGLPWSPAEQMTALAEQFSLRCVALTRGEHGSVLYADGRWSEHSGIPTRVKDTVGAGDSFAAAMTLGLLAEWDLDEINHRANAVAAYVASCEGATPILLEPLRRPFRAHANTRSDKPAPSGSSAP